MQLKTAIADRDARSKNQPQQEKGRSAMAIHGAVRTQRGRDRRTNEDAFELFPELHLARCRRTPPLSQKEREKTCDAPKGILHLH